MVQKKTLKAEQETQLGALRWEAQAPSYTSAMICARHLGLA